MAKHWSPGTVKTRLAAELGEVTAARLYRVWVRHLCRSLASVADHRSLVCAPPQHRAAMAQAILNWGVADDWSLENQTDGDLGQRMADWFERSLATEKKTVQTGVEVGSGFDEPHRRAVLVGADCPLIDPKLIETAFGLLESNDVVLGPAADGGYYLIGLRSWKCEGRTNLGPMDRLFAEMPWSTGDVFQMTRDRIAQAGGSLALLPTRQDIDTLTDWQGFDTELRQERNSSPTSSFGRLRAELDAITSDHQDRSGIDLDQAALPEDQLDRYGVGVSDQDPAS